MPEVWGAGVRRPLTARSVIASTLLGVDPPRLPARALVRSGELFGLSEGATRTALSRMAAAGDVEPDDGHYALAGPLLERHERQRRARGTDPTAGADWDGSWLLAVVTAERRPAAERSDFREAARRLRLAEVREGLWARPDDASVDPEAAAYAVVAGQATWVRGARPVDLGPFVAAFDLTGWAAVAEQLIAEMRAAQTALDQRRPEAVASTFVTAAAVLRHLLADPSLPSELLPVEWPGQELRATFDRFDAAFKETWRTWYRSFTAE
jgi:phenylacetic acid degradation operon negative regulatory protein